jgi:hypothetical protein
MNQRSVIQNILLLFLLSIALTSCDLFSSDSGQSDVIENSPFYYSLSGMTNADIECDGYSLITQWAEISDLGDDGEVQTGLHASVRDTVDSIAKWQRYNLLFIRKSKWPDAGLFTVAEIADIRRGGSNHFFVYFNSLYRENGLDDLNHIFIDDFVAFAESGSIEITTSDESNLRGTFSLNLSLTERRTWDGSEETVETSFSEQLEIKGAFDIDLTRNKASFLSSLPHREMTNMCGE